MLHIVVKRGSKTMSRPKRIELRKPSNQVIIITGGAADT
jgi:hypothetical protein